MKPTINRISLCNVYLKHSALTCVLFIASCGDSADNIKPSEQWASPSLVPTTSDSLLPPVAFQVDDVAAIEPLKPHTSAHLAQYPVDKESDDVPGLIVTGVGSSSGQTLVSPFLLSTSMFRLQRLTPGSGDGYVHMVVYDEAVSMSAHIDFFQPPLDTCLLRDPLNAESTLERALDVSVSGGEGVVINSPGGPWFTFDRESVAGGGFVYQVDNKLPGAFPEHATLSVPGDVHPNVSAYPIYEPSVPVRLLPDKRQTIGLDSKFSWIEESVNTYVKINLLAYDDADEFLGFAVTCWVVDDGEFEMPEAVINYLKSSESMLRARYSRVYARLDWISGMAIHQVNEVAE